MNFKEMANSMTPEIYEKIRKAVELGKWPNGESLSTMQKEVSLQAIIAYDMQHLEIKERVGYIFNDKKQISNFDQLDKQLETENQVVDFRNSADTES